MKHRVLLLVLVMIHSPMATAQPDEIVRAHEAVDHAGEYAMVCGTIASATYRRDVRGDPTYLNFDKPYPEHDFSAVVYGKNRKYFDPKPEKLEGFKACVYGKVKLYRGKAQIELVRGNQLSVKAP